MPCPHYVQDDPGAAQADQPGVSLDVLEERMAAGHWYPDPVPTTHRRRVPIA